MLIGYLFTISNKTIELVWHSAVYIVDRDSGQWESH